MSPAIAVIGVGEVGSAVIAALVRGGRTVVAHDLRPEAAAARLEAADVAGSVELVSLDAAGACPLVLSAVIPTAAVDALEALIQTQAARGDYLDVNSTGPEEKRRMAGLAQQAGFSSFTDATIGGGGFRLSSGPVFHIAGSGADTWSGVLGDAGFRTDVLGTTEADVGKAASLKMMRTAFTKGYEALIVESLGLARRADLLEQVVDSVGETFDGIPFAEVADLLVRGHVSHCQRRLGEVRMAKSTVEVLLPGCAIPMIEATEQRYRASSEHLGERYGAPEPADLREALLALEVSGEP